MLDEKVPSARNYAMVAGFLAIFVISVISSVLCLGGKSVTETLGGYGTFAVFFVCAAVLMISGVVLAMLHKRAQVAIAFMFLSMAFVFAAFAPIYGPDSLDPVPMCIVLILVGIMMLMTQNEQKVISSVLILTFSVFPLIGALAGGSAMSICIVVGSVIQAVISLYSALAIILKRYGLPGYGYLTVDEECESNDGAPVHFKISGAILGYMTLAIPMMASIIYHTKLTGMTWESCAFIYIFSGIMLILFGFVTYFVGRMKNTTMLFIAVGLVTALAGVVGSYSWLLCAILIIIGLIAIFRYDERMLIGVVVILYGLTFLFADQGIFVSVDAPSIFICLVPFVIITYVSFALCSNGKYPLC